VPHRPSPSPTQMSPSHCTQRRWLHASECKGQQCVEEGLCGVPGSRPARMRICSDFDMLHVNTSTSIACDGQKDCNEVIGEGRGAGRRGGCVRRAQMTSHQQALVFMMEVQNPGVHVIHCAIACVGTLDPSMAQCLLSEGTHSASTPTSASRCQSTTRLWWMSKGLRRVLNPTRRIWCTCLLLTASVRAHHLEHVWS
jgi:hypothetical protein